MNVHVYSELLDVFRLAIRGFVPTIPKALKQEAKDTLETLQKNFNADERQIKQAFFDVSLKEYPYRRAYQELTQGETGKRLVEFVLEHVDPSVRAFLKLHLDAGVSLQELMKSDLFETGLTPAEQYQVEDGVFVASSKISDDVKYGSGQTHITYERLVKKWQDHALEIRRAIDELEALAEQGDAAQRAEILEKVARFREGFLITEEDPDFEAVTREVEYWKELFNS